MDTLFPPIDWWYLELSYYKCTGLAFSTLPISTQYLLWLKKTFWCKELPIIHIILIWFASVYGLYVSMLMTSCRLFLDWFPVNNFVSKKIFDRNMFASCALMLIELTVLSSWPFIQIWFLWRHFCTMTPGGILVG